MSWKNPFVILTYKWNSVLEGKVLMCSQKVLHDHERCFVGDEVFWSLKDFWRLKKDFFLFFSLHWVFSFEKHFLHTCNWICPQNKKKIVFTTQCCFEKRTWKWQWKTTKSFTAKSSRILEDFYEPFIFGKTKKFRKFYIFSCLVKWNWLKHFLYW